MRALISVSDKEGLEDFARFLAENGYEIIATGGTKKFLDERGIKAISVEEITGYPEILNGRVKTLHPAIHGAILAERKEDLEKYNLKGIDMVVVNLYPFEKNIGNERDMIENIDIGGVALLRAAAKNYKRVLVVSSPSQYEEVIEAIKKGEINEEFRRKYALEAFALTASYDAMIYNSFWNEFYNGMPEHFLYHSKKKMELRYGENPHQRGALYMDGNVEWEQLHGKKLSFNNLYDMDAAWNIVMEFERPAVAIIKHANPCGAALGRDVKEAYMKALEGDPISAYGSIVASNKKIDEEAAKEMKKLFIEVLIAPEYSQEALDILERKKNIRIIKVKKWKKEGWNLRRIDGGLLVQDWDTKRLDNVECVSKRMPSEQEMRDLVFAWSIVRYVKSNAIVFAKNEALVGVGAGQMSRVDSVKIAAMKAGDRARGAVMASDAFFPFRDAIDEAAKAGVTAVIQPGGSKRDKEVIEAIDEHNMAMLFTGFRVFRH